MNTKAIRSLFKTAKRFLSNNKTAILIGTGVVGFFSAVVECGRVSPMAKELIEDKKQELGVEKLSVMDTVKTAGPLYIPTVLMAVSSAGFIIGGTAANLRQNATLAAALAMSEHTADVYKESVNDIIGDKKQKLIEDNIVQKAVQNAPVTEESINAIPGNGQFICIDTYSGRPFRSDKNKIQSIINHLNESLNNDDLVSFNDYLNGVGLSSCDFGSENGWNRFGGLIEPTFTSILKDDIPCLAVSLYPQPRYKYYNLA